MPNVKRYVIFKSNIDIPAKGWDNKVADYNTLTYAFMWLVTHAERNDYTWYTIVDLETGEHYHIDSNDIPALDQDTERT